MSLISTYPFIGSRGLVLIALTIFAVPAQSESEHSNNPPPAQSESDSSTIYPQYAVVSGRTYSEWSAAWQQWAMSMPATAHPLTDTADCSTAQSGPVWFLGGRFCVQGASSPASCDNTPTARSCTVPAGKSLYFPILNIECLDAEAQNGDCIGPTPNGVNTLLFPYPAQIRQVLGEHMDMTKDLQLTVDGKPYKGDIKKQFRVQSPVYTVQTPEGNLLQAAFGEKIGAGEYWGVDDGVYVMLKPLRKGAHTINFKGTFPQYNFSLDFTYNIIQQ